MNADDRAHWLEPSPPIPVDGEEPRPRPRLLPESAPDEDVPASAPPPRDYEDGRATSHSS
jgi:hypothetical protein